MKKVYFLLLFLTIFRFYGSSQDAQRIVSLVPWMTKSLYLMGE